jgi:PmbA protein
MNGGTLFQMQRWGWVASIIAATAGPVPAIFFETLFVKISVKSNVKKTAPATASHAHAHDGFSYSRDHFEGLVDIALHHAKKLGATNAGAEASEGAKASWKTWSATATNRWV